MSYLSQNDYASSKNLLPIEPSPPESEVPPHFLMSKGGRWMKTSGELWWPLSPVTPSIKQLTSSSDVPPLNKLYDLLVGLLARLFWGPYRPISSSKDGE